MTTSLARLRDAFVSLPAAPARRSRSLAALFVRPAIEAGPTVWAPPAAAARTAVAGAAVLCAPGDAAVAGAAVGLVLAARGGSPCALVCRWTGGEGEVVSAAAWPAARRLADRLRRRGLVVGVAGRAVTVALPADPGEASGVLARASAAADVPVVLVVAGPRPDGFAPILAAQDRLVVVAPADAAPGLEAVAVQDAARAGAPAGLLRLPATPAARAIATTGLVLPPAVRRAVTHALEDAA
jgi:hypothetical protein